MPQAPAFLSTHAREQLEADDRLRSALLSRFVLAGLSERDAAEATNLVSGLTWFVLTGHRDDGAAIPRWTKDGETALVTCEHGAWWAWNRSRGHLAVLPDDQSRGGFPSRADAEVALIADGWMREGVR